MKKLKINKKFSYLIGALSAIYIAILVGVYFFQSQLMYFPDKDFLKIEDYQIDGAKEVEITSLDGTKLQLWYAMPDQGKQMIVYYHGNSFNLGHRAAKFQELRSLGYGFVAVSYRGFGKSEGEPSKDGIIFDAKAALSFAKSLGFDESNIVVVGESLGSGIATEIVANHQAPVKGMFLITPYTSIADRAQEKYWYLPARYILKDNFDSYSIISQIKCPILIIHGDCDDIIPHTHSYKLEKQITAPYKLIIYENTGHSNYDNKVAFKEMTDFLVANPSNINQDALNAPADY